MVRDSGAMVAFITPPMRERSLAGKVRGFGEHRSVETDQYGLVGRTPSNNRKLSMFDLYCNCLNVRKRSFLCHPCY